MLFTVCIVQIYFQKSSELVIVGHESNILSSAHTKHSSLCCNFARKSCHITTILKEMHWLPVSQRIVFKLMLIVHKSVNNIAPIYISELLKFALQQHVTPKVTNFKMDLGVTGLFLSWLQDSGIFFQLNSNLVIV